MLPKAATVVATGAWHYDGAVETPVHVIALPEEPTPLGPDGLLYYASFTGIDSAGYAAVSDAKAARKRAFPRRYDGASGLEMT